MTPQPITRFQDIPPFMEGNYKADVPLAHVQGQLDHYEKDYRQKLDIDPDGFQRAHVWNTGQQIAFVEHVLRGGNNTVIKVQLSGLAKPQVHAQTHRNCGRQAKADRGLGILEQ